MPRDRLADLHTLGGRDKEGQDDVELGHVSVNLALEDPVDEFLSQVAETQKWLLEMAELVEQLKQKHGQLIAATKETDKMKEELEQLMMDAKKIAKRIRDRLKTMEDGFDVSASGEPATSARHRMRKTQHSSLVRHFLDVMNDFNDCQVEYNDKIKQKLRRQLEIMGENLTSEEIDEMMDSENQDVFTQGLIMETEQARQSLKDITSRHQDIVKLEQSIRELGEMFKDLATLVQSQGELVDRIEYNVENTEDFIVSAVGQLEQAVQHQKQSRKKLILIIVCVIVLLAIVGLAIGLSV